MTLTKKGSRRIVVDGQEYRWRIPHQPTESQGCEWGNMIVAVEQFTDPGATLIIDTGRLRLDSWISPPSGNGVTPKEVAQAIRDAIAAGWKPTERGPQFPYIMRSSAEQVA
ncbi:MAG: hypothetical protein JWQ02_1761 [Capsulimonas sp.]|nr:hypothetical protein [Capsulimonas sp.]